MGQKGEGGRGRVMVRRAGWRDGKKEGGAGGWEEGGPGRGWEEEGQEEREWEESEHYINLLLWQSVCLSPEYDPHPVRPVGMYTSIYEKDP